MEDVSQRSAGPTATDEALLLAFQGGSHAAFEELFERYRQPIFCFFRRRLNDCGRAEELAQETFLAVLKGLARYEPRALVRTYLYGIALKLLSAERRRQARAQDPENGNAPDLPSSTETTLWIRQAVERLDESHREILMLREFEQLTYSEIAVLLRQPVNTVRSRLFRARTALKEMLAERGQPSGRPR